MLTICLILKKSQLIHAYERYAYKKECTSHGVNVLCESSSFSRLYLDDLWKFFNLSVFVNKKNITDILGEKYLSNLQTKTRVENVCSKYGK